MRVLLEAELTMRRRLAEIELDKHLGGPTKAHHVRADQAIDLIDNTTFWLGELERWHWEAA